MFTLEYQNEKNRWVFTSKWANLEAAKSEGDKWFAHCCRIKDSKGRIVSKKKV